MVFSDLLEDKLWVLFTRPSGTEFEADVLSFKFSSRPRWVAQFLFYDGLTAALKSAFLVDETMTRSYSEYCVIEDELDLLRVRIFSIPRFTAFMMVRHSRLGAGSALAALGDDVCHMILKLSIE
jgi:hypothetical protein